MMRPAATNLLLLALALAPLSAAPAQKPAPPAARPAARPVDAIGPNSRIIPPPAAYKFANSQTLIYDVEWRLWHAGTARLRLDAAGAEERVTGAADSAGFVSLLYTVHDRFESFFDAKTFCSRQLTKNIEEGFRKKQTAIRFDSARGKAVLDEKDLKQGTSKHVENDAPACATDVVAGIFYAGSLPLGPGGVYTLPLNDGGKTVDVRVTVEGREHVKTPAGEFNTVRVQPESLGLMKNRGKIWIWYTDDAAHTPVQMRAKLFWGTLTFRLARLEKDKK
jgi:uncharacterized protein DUF3108